MYVHTVYFIHAQNGSRNITTIRAAKYVHKNYFNILEHALTGHLACSKGVKVGN